MNNEDFEQCKKEMVRRKTYPYFFHNRELAKAFYKRLKEEVPTASYYEGEEIGQAVCYDEKAQKRLIKRIEYLVGEHQKAMVALEEIKIDIMGDLGHPLFRKGGA